MSSEPNRELAPDVELILGPDGLAAPADVPPEIFAAALATHLEPRRIDMLQLSVELGIGRTTLYRKVGDRERLLGAVAWFCARGMIAEVISTTRRRRGIARVVETVRLMMQLIHDSDATRRFLDEEPEAALRILTSKHGPVQRGVIDVVERLLAHEEERGTLSLSIDRGRLAYGIVRIVESFLYADVVADAEPDLDAAAEIIEALLRGTMHPPRRR